MLGNIWPTTRNLTALAEHAAAVRVFEFNEVMVVNLSMAFGIADLTATHALGADGMRAFDPVADIDVMDVLFDDVVAREPGEIVPVPDLVVHFRFVREPLDAIARTAIPITAHRHNIAQSAILDAFDHFNVAGLMVSLETDSHLEIFLSCFGRGS